MENIFVEFLPPWVETGIQPAFYDKESGSVLQQTARMYARVNMLIRMFNKLSKQSKETIEEYINKFNELYSYVHDYFDNLDVQEEINNKLDEMYEDGQLTQLIAQFLSLNAVMTFTSVANMKLAENLVNGSTCETYGFYSANDGGGAKYIVREVTNQDTIDEMTIIALNDVNLVAELIIEDTMNVKQFGAKGDSNTNDTTAIQCALDNVQNINVPSGTYMIDAVTNLKVRSNTKIILSNDATLEAITNSDTHYAILWLEDVTNVEISGGTLKGDRDTHTGDSGEWGHCIRIYKDCDEIYIHDINLIDAWGDGIACGKVTGKIRTSRVYVNRARRNGYSIASTSSFVSTDDVIENSGGTAPQCGVDIEPDYTTDKLTNVVFRNLKTKDCTGPGMQIYIKKDLDSPISIDIQNHYDHGSENGLRVAKYPSITGKIVVENSYYEDSYYAGINLSEYYYGDCPITIIRPRVINCNLGGSNTYLYGASITAHILDTAEITGLLGNIEIVEPYTINSNTQTMAESMDFRNDKYADTNLRIKGIKILNPLNSDSKYIYTAKGEDIIITDQYGVLGHGYKISNTLPVGQRYSVFDNSIQETTSRLTFTMNSGHYDIGYKIKVQNMNPSTQLDFLFASDEYCRSLAGNTVAPRIRLVRLGDAIEVEKVAEHEWIVTYLNHTPTVNPA